MHAPGAAHFSELSEVSRAATGLRFPPTLLFDHPTTDALVDHLLGLVTGPAADAPSASGPAPAALDDADMAGLAQLTEAEAEAVLLAELGETEPAP